MSKFIPLLLVLLFAQLVANSQTEKQETDEKIQNRDFYSNLDSLLTLSYVKTSIDKADISENNVEKRFADTTYQNRLQKLKTVIPLHFNDEVKKFIHFYTSEENRIKVGVMLGLAEHYTPLFESTLRNYKLPLELKYLPLAESGLYPQAVSKDGAAGMWQLMYPVARRYGLKITSFTDERRDPLKAADASARYLKEMYEIYHDWILALAAFNCGPANVNKAIGRSGGEQDFWKIYHYLPTETRENVPAFIAVLYLINYNDRHNIKTIKIDYPQQVDSLELEKRLHLGQISEVMKIPLQELVDLNPEYRQLIINPENDANILRLRGKFTDEFLRKQDTIYAYKDSVFFKPKREIIKPPKVTSVRSSTYSSSYTPPTPKGKSKVIYYVKSGDTVGLIAQWFGVKSSHVRYWNGLRGNRIYVNQKLVIYVPKGKASTYKRLNSMTFAQKQRFIGKNVPKKKAKKSPVRRSGEFVYYTVKKGDTLWDIAKNYPGVSSDDIMKINNFSRNYQLHPGQVIKIKMK